MYVDILVQRCAKCLNIDQLYLAQIIVSIFMYLSKTKLKGWSFKKYKQPGENNYFFPPTILVKPARA